MATFNDTRIREVLQGRKAMRAYPMPFAPDVSVGIKLLSDGEIDQCRIEAQRYCEKQRANLDIDPDFLERENRRQIIWRAFTDPTDAERPFYPSDRDVRGLDAELVRALFEAYYEHQAWLAPLRTSDRERVLELAEALGKAPGSTELLVDCDFDTLRSLCISLAALHHAT